MTQKPHHHIVWESKHRNKYIENMQSHNTIDETQYYAIVLDLFRFLFKWKRKNHIIFTNWMWIWNEKRDQTKKKTWRRNCRLKNSFPCFCWVFVKISIDFDRQPLNAIRRVKITLKTTRTNTFRFRTNHNLVQVVLFCLIIVLWFRFVAQTKPYHRPKSASVTWSHILLTADQH